MTNPETIEVLYHLLILFSLNYIADYLLQTREMGRKKSSNFVFLFAHIFIIFMVILFGAYFLFGFDLALKLSFWNAVTHLIVDMIYWNLYGLIVVCKKIGGLPVSSASFIHHKKELIDEGYKYWEDKKFFDTIGIDCHTHLYLITLVYLFVINPIGG